MAYQWSCSGPGGAVNRFISPDEICLFLESENKRSKVVKATFDLHGHFHILYLKTVRKYYRLQFMALCGAYAKLNYFQKAKVIKSLKTQLS